MKTGAGGAMTQIRSSLLLKLILAFCLVSVLGIVIMALLAGRVSRQEFTRFINESRYQGLIDGLSDYYAEHGSFTGADYLLAETNLPSGANSSEFMVMNAGGNILLSTARVIPPGPPSPDLTRFGYSITVNDQVVAYLIPMRPPRNPAESAVENIQRINLSLFVGVVFAILIASLFGWLMARNIIRPLRELNLATQAIAQGDLENQVAIVSGDEIGALAASFNRMTTSLKRARDLRNQMTADIAHELRNPLTIILGNAEALSDGVLPATPENLEIIYDEAKHLSRLVDDLRTLSLSEAGDLRLQRSLAVPAVLLERCAARAALRVAESGLSINVQAGQDLPELYVDVERIQQVLANLVDNSIKHSTEGGVINLQASASTRQVGWVEISVTDSGAGILPEDLPFVFERFYRGKQSSARIQDGSGLGLAISRALVEQHDGQISVESLLGQGTRICFSLPPANPAADQDSKQA